MLTDDALAAEHCVRCEQPFNRREVLQRYSDEVLQRQRERVERDAADRQGLIAGRIGVVLGAIMFVAGIALIAISGGGTQAVLLSRWGITGLVGSVVAMGTFHQLDQPLHVPALVLGVLWLVLGLLCWGLV